MKKKYIIKGAAGLACAALAFFLSTGAALPVQAADVKQEVKIELSAEEKETVQEVIDFVKEKLDNGELETEEQIRDAIAEGEEKFDVKLSDSQKDKIVQVTEKVQDLGLDTDTLAEQAQALYEKYGADLFEKASDDIADMIKEAVTDSVKSSVSSFFTDFGNNIKEFFGSLFS